MADKNQYDPRASIDVITFYSALFYKLAATNKFEREDFQKLISETYNNLPVRVGSLGGGFWENICAIHNIQIRATDEDTLDERAIKSLADAIWLPYDQDLQNAAKHNK